MRELKSAIDFKEAERIKICEMYLTSSTEAVAELFGTTRSVIENIAYRRGFRKSTYIRTEEPKKMTGYQKLEWLKNKWFVYGRGAHMLQVTGYHIDTDANQVTIETTHRTVTLPLKGLMKRLETEFLPIAR